MRFPWRLTSGPDATRVSGVTASLVALLLGAAAASFFLVYVPRQRALAVERWSRELELRAEIRKTAIDGWVADGLGDAALVASYPSAQLLLMGHEEGTAAHLGSLLATFAGLKGYLRVLVLDGRGRVIAASAGGTAMEPRCREATRADLDQDVPTADFHLHPNGSPVVAFLAPVERPGMDRGLAPGAVVIEADPGAWLYPYLTRRSSVEQTAETVLVRREGDSVVFLCPLRHDPAPPLTLRLPWNTADLAAVAALQHDQHSVLGIDYRHVPVLAASRRIKGAPWAVVVKLDQAEALSASRRDVRSTAAVGAAAIGALAAVLVAFWWAQRRAHEADLGRSRARFGLLLDQANDGVLFMARDDRIIEANKKAEEMYGRSREELLGMTGLELRAEEARPQWRSDWDTAAREGRHVFETINRRRDGSTFPVEVSSRLIELDGQPAFLAVVRDTSERKRAEEEQARLRLAVEQAVESIVITDTKGTIVYVNPASQRLTGYTREEMLGQNPRMFKSGRQDEGFYRSLWDTLARGEVWAGRFVNRRKDGTLFEEEATISPVRDGSGQVVNYVAVKRDISSERRLEQQLLQAQKMEAIGRLAGGVAHDFNNLLGVITGFSELLGRDLGPQHPGSKRLSQIQRAADQAASLTRQLLTFSRKQVLQPRVLDLNQVVTDVEKMLRRLIGEDVQLVTVFGADLGYVRADPAQMEQVILNLAVNARDAMPKGGKLIIETSNAALDEGYVRSHAEVRPGRYVLLAVSDTGQGMDAETQVHIFEPFFTTKEEGKGTGLGLATVFGVVKQSDGHINVYSEPGKGSTFKIYLPQVEFVGLGRAERAPVEPSPSGTETLLLVEDAKALRVMIREVLEGGGYTVLEAANAEEALLKIGSPGGPIHLMLTDVIMPRMSGAELAVTFRRVRPGARVLYMSGYTDESLGHHGVVEAGTHFIQKPFTSKALLQMVRKVLDA